MAKKGNVKITAKEEPLLKWTKMELVEGFHRSQDTVVIQNNANAEKDEKIKELERLKNTAENAHNETVYDVGEIFDHVVYATNDIRRLLKTIDDFLKICKPEVFIITEKLRGLVSHVDGDSSMEKKKAELDITDRLLIEIVEQLRRIEQWDESIRITERDGLSFSHSRKQSVILQDLRDRLHR